MYFNVCLFRLNLEKYKIKLLFLKKYIFVSTHVVYSENYLIFISVLNTVMYDSYFDMDVYGWGSITLGNLSR